MGGRALKSNPWSQVSRPTKLLVLGSQDAEGAKAGAPNWDALAQPRQGQQFCSRSNSRLFQREALETLRHSSSLAPAGAEPSSWPRLLK